MNLLTAAAWFGVITAVFQFGWGASLLGVDKTDRSRHLSP
jgi:putative drug exporter of the RND superfamily